MSEPDFDRIDAAIESMQSRLDAMLPSERGVGINRLRAMFRRSGVVLDAQDETTFSNWAAGSISSAVLVAHFGPRLRQLQGPYELQ